MPLFHPQMTTNCISEPRSSYADRMFTTGEVGWAGVTHIEGKPGQAKDFSSLIKMAQVGGRWGLCCWQWLRWFAAVTVVIRQRAASSARVCGASDGTAPQLLGGQA
jgi:hypothetical protein